MFSKIMREDSVGSPKHQRSTGSVDSPSYKGFGIGKTTTDLTVSESPKSARKAESEILPECNWPVRHRKRCLQKSSLSHEHHSRQVDTGPVMESSTHGSASQSTDMNRTDQDGLAEDVTEQCSSPVPGVGLAYIAFLSYCYFIFPFSAYWSGLFLGLVFGLILGLVLIQWGSMKHLPTSQQHRLHGTSYNNILFEALQSNVPSLKVSLMHFRIYIFCKKRIGMIICICKVLYLHCILPYYILGKKQYVIKEMCLNSQCS